MCVCVRERFIFVAYAIEFEWVLLNHFGNLIDIFLHSFLKQWIGWWFIIIALWYLFLWNENWILSNLIVFVSDWALEIIMINCRHPEMRFYQICKHCTLDFFVVELNTFFVRQIFAENEQRTLRKREGGRGSVWEKQKTMNFWCTFD